MTNRKIQRFAFTFTLPVAWGDMDALGHVNNVSFARYFETGRAMFFQHAFADLESWYEGPGKTGPVMSGLELEYRAQVVFPADLEVSIGIVDGGSRTFTMGCSMWLGDQVAAFGSSRHIWIDFSTGRPMRLPTEFRTSMQALLDGGPAG